MRVLSHIDNLTLQIEGESYPYLPGLVDSLSTIQGPMSTSTSTLSDLISTILLYTLDMPQISMSSTPSATSRDRRPRRPAPRLQVVRWAPFALVASTLRAYQKKTKVLYVIIWTAFLKHEQYKGHEWPVSFTRLFSRRAIVY